ncbi:MAG TPA: hypothetical protein VHG91_07835, partial [Longimicrobium sp.]|nr:hypothetical protein [Longimicrobium sp.]
MAAAALAGACARDNPLSPGDARLDESAVTAIASVTPDSAVVGDSGVVLTVRGHGFDSTSVVWIDPYLPVVTVSASDSVVVAQIAGVLWSPAIHEVRVYTGYEATEPAAFVVGNPAPVLTGMSPGWAEAGEWVGEVTVEGSGFLPGATVRWNGSPRSTTWISETRVSFYPEWSDLMYVDQAAVTVANPGPGGGPSGALTFQVGMRLFVHTQGATAGSDGFELEVHGDGFGPGATVYWNGSPRSTWVSSAKRMSAWIPASDVAQPGGAEVTVTAPGLPGGYTPWKAGTVTIRAAGAATVQQTTLPLSVRDLVYVPDADRIYATVYDGDLASHLAVIDPHTGTVVDQHWIGLGARYLALAEDGRHLWVGVDGDNAVVRFDTRWGYVNQQVQLDSGFVAEDLAAVPGRPDRVAVARKRLSGSPRHAGVAVYEWGQALPNATPSGVGSNVIEFGATRAVLYGMDTETPANRIPWMSVGDDGVTVTYAGWQTGLPADADMVYAAGRLYTTGGPAIDLGYNDWAGFFDATGAVRPDVETGRAYFLGASGIAVSDINTFDRLATLPVPPLAFEPASETRRHLVRWGTGRVARRSKVLMSDTAIPEAPRKYARPVS